MSSKYIYKFFFLIKIIIIKLSRVAARVLDHLTEPMRRLHLDEKEYVALKAVALFDPS